MSVFVWLFPILFMFHDMEEIIGFRLWLDKNREMLKKRFPKVERKYQEYSTEGMALAVFEEFIVCTLISIIAFFVINEYVYLLWLGGFIGYTLHLFIHIIQSIIVKKYIPALATSVICLPLSIWIIIECIEILNRNIGLTILFSFVGIIVVFLNLLLAQFILKKFTQWINQM